MSYVRTAQHRAMRSAMIHRWKPWLKSTGAKTEEGKRKSAMNAYKGAVRQEQRAIARLLREQLNTINELNDLLDDRND